MHRQMFKEFMQLRESANDWKADAKGKDLQNGYKPNKELKVIIAAFLQSGEIKLLDDTEKPIMMKKKELYLVGGPVRDFMRNVTQRRNNPDIEKDKSADQDLVTPATPSQVAIILSAAGFKRAEDKSGKGGSELHLPEKFWIKGDAKKIEDANEKDADRVWYVQKRDSSKEKKPFVIGVRINSEIFEISTFRKDAKVTDGESEVDFTNNLAEDAEKRDLTINSMYILLDNENECKKIFDPSQHGIYHVNNGIVKTVGKAKDRFEEDPLRAMRAIRLHAKFGKSDELDADIKNTIPDFLNLEERVAPDKIRSEFLKGLLDPQIDLKKYFRIYHNTKLLHTVFPGVRFESPSGLPPTFTDKKDKVLALAWILQHNPIEKVEEAIGSKRKVNGEDKSSGWQAEERKAIIYLLKLKEFTPEKVYKFMKHRMGTGLSAKQIRSWVEMFHKDGRKSVWGDRVNAFADHEPSVSWEHAIAAGKDRCPSCDGMNSDCRTCGGTGKMPMDKRGQVIADMEHQNFKKKIQL